MKNSITVLLFLVTYASTSIGQGWIGNGSTLSAYNSSLQLAPLNVGIGVNAPTAQLHTTGNVRFAGLLKDNFQTRVIVQDVNGLLSWRDASTLSTPSQNAWLLNGNAATIPNSNFLGTTDNQRLVFRTNNTEKLTILANGDVGVGLSNPTVRLHVTNSAGSMLYPYETGVFEDQIDTKLGVYNSSVGTLGINSGGAGIAFGYSRVLNASNNYPGYEIQYGAVTNANFFLRFNSLNRNNAGAVVGSNSNEMVINNGNVGINLGPVTGLPTLPTARLHTNGTVRFQNLPAGNGSVLVVDGNGNVFRGSSTAKITGNSTSNQDMIDKLAFMEKEVKSLKLLIEGLVNSKTNFSNVSKSFLVYPNPTTNAINVEVNPSSNNNPQSYKVVIKDILGIAIIEKVFESKSVNIPLKNAQSGTYVACVYDKRGQLLQTEKVVIQK